MKLPLTHSIALLHVALTCMLLGACVPSPIDFTTTTSLPKDEGVVFGRVRLLEGGEEQNLSTVFGESKCKLIIVSAKTSQALYVPLQDDGSFIWHLPEGNYTIASYEWRSYGTLTGRIFAGFNVFHSRANYIGTLLITIAGARFNVDIVDDYETALSTVQDRLPFSAESLTKQLMKMEPRR